MHLLARADLTLRASPAPPEGRSRASGAGTRRPPLPCPCGRRLAAARAAGHPRCQSCTVGRGGAEAQGQPSEASCQRRRQGMLVSGSAHSPGLNCGQRCLQAQTSNNMHHAVAVAAVRTDTCTCRRFSTLPPPLPHLPTITSARMMSQTTVLPRELTICSGGSSAGRRQYRPASSGMHNQCESVNSRQSSIQGPAAHRRKIDT